MFVDWFDNGFRCLVIDLMLDSYLWDDWFNVGFRCLVTDLIMDSDVS